MNRDILDYVPAGTQQFGYGIDPARVLTTKERGIVKTRFLALAADKVPKPATLPNLAEVRWSDDLKAIYIPKESGLMELGFVSMYPEHEPIREGRHYAIFLDSNPAAHALLEAIEYAVKPWQER